MASLLLPTRPPVVGSWCFSTGPGLPGAVSWKSLGCSAGAAKGWWKPHQCPACPRDSSWVGVGSIVAAPKPWTLPEAVPAAGSGAARAVSLPVPHCRHCGFEKTTGWTCYLGSTVEVSKFLWTPGGTQCLSAQTVCPRFCFCSWQPQVNGSWSFQRAQLSWAGESFICEWWFVLNCLSGLELHPWGAACLLGGMQRALLWLLLAEMGGFQCVGCPQREGSGSLMKPWGMTCAVLCPCTWELSTPGPQEHHAGGWNTQRRDGAGLLSCQRAQGAGGGSWAGTGGRAGPSCNTHLPHVPGSCVAAGPTGKPRAPPPPCPTSHGAAVGCRHYRCHRGALLEPSQVWKALSDFPLPGSGERLRRVPAEGPCYLQLSLLQACPENQLLWLAQQMARPWPRRAGCSGLGL